jgi:hypothetical protein
LGIQWAVRGIIQGIVGEVLAGLGRNEKWKQKE